MKLRVVETASEATAKRNANPFPVLGRPRLCKDSPDKKAPHAEQLPEGWPAPTVGLPNGAPPEPKPPQPEPQKPQSNLHRLTILRWVARLKRIFS
jgi:hypothetical protein